MTYKLIQEIEGTDYTLLKSTSTYTPYVLAFRFDPETVSWAQGHYFKTMFGVETYLKVCAKDGYVKDGVKDFRLQDDRIVSLH